MNPVAPERRRSSRWPIGLHAACSLVGKRQGGADFTATTVNVSSHGALMETEQDLSIGTAVQVSLHWPILPQNTRKLKLVVKGRVMRIEPGRAAIDFEKCKFGTLPVSPEANK
jgi:hypothetical protein